MFEDFLSSPKSAITVLTGASITDLSYIGGPQCSRGGGSFFDDEFDLSFGNVAFDFCCRLPIVSVGKRIFHRCFDRYGFLSIGLDLSCLS
ncbi:MAG: hypothetical protein VB853_15890 [Pirellulales bacterium]